MSGFYKVQIDVLVPEGLPAWLARRLGVSEAKARVLVKRAVRTHGSLISKSATVLAGTLGDEEPLLVFESNFSRTPRAGDRWFDCGSNAARRMRDDGRAIDDEEDGRC